jgi:hypothetical protein
MEWAVWWAHDPWGEQRADARAAQVCAMLFNAHRSRDSQPGKIADFMLYRPPFEPEPEPVKETDEQAMVRLMGQINAHNRKARR